ncbi:hypothetical protein NA57DRAFT_41562 [Rhizodiscina lignyota]|uniref:ATP-dependent protease n=1 Tax=Rhizodiscina lignyota TaxID=1504668 RepID=A0A9P4IER0_9PEZI|nr:hypothetical protein NA57DRAFT_41562 [Rhizodiscina lignyota]
MSDNGVVLGLEGRVGLSAHEDARALVRLIQCSQCSRPLRTPVTLPCGHSVCRDCLPQPHQRENISYPDTPDRQTGVRCPVRLCEQEHPVGEVNVDVTLAKIMELVCTMVDKARTNAELCPTLVTELLAKDDLLSEKESETEKMDEGRSNTFYGGRLLSTFTMAELGELDFRADVRYESLSDNEDQYRQLDLELLEEIRETTQKELDCQICYNAMLDPVTTSCGHTFCRRCLTRVLDHSSYCPACRRSLPIPPSLSQQQSNERIKSLLNNLCPETIAARAEAVALEESSGIGELNVSLFVCTLSFPQMPTFLHIFEPRYRLMIRRAAESNRQFGMLMYNRSRTSQGDLGVTDYCMYGTMLHIQHLQMLPDGRSIIETRGLHRFKVLETGMRDGYIVGRIERVEDVSLAEEERLEAEEIRVHTQPPDSPMEPESNESSNGNGRSNNNRPDVDSLTTRQLLERAMDFIVEMRGNSAPWLHQRILDAYGEPPTDPANFPYWFASVLPIADEQKYLLLTTTSVRQRLKIVVGWIRRLEDQRW